MTGVGMGRRPLLVMALGWLSVVVAVAAITFVVVDRAGRGVGRASAAGTVALVESTAQSSTSAAPPSPTPSETESEAPPKSEKPSSTRAPSRTSQPRQATPAPRTASFTNEGGTVVASCRGSEISLDSIRPRDGWRFEKEVEHGGLEVVFKAGEREVEILLVCVRGVPTQGGS